MSAEEGQLERRVPLQGLCRAFLASLTRCSLSGVRDTIRGVSIPGRYGLFVTCTAELTAFFASSAL